MTEIKRKEVDAETSCKPERAFKDFFPFMATETCEESLKLCVVYFPAVCEHYNQAAGELLAKLNGD
jgi:hypothetical protein